MDMLNTINNVSVATHATQVIVAPNNKSSRKIKNAHKSTYTLTGEQAQSAMTNAAFQEGTKHEALIRLVQQVNVSDEQLNLRKSYIVGRLTAWLMPKGANTETMPEHLVKEANTIFDGLSFGSKGGTKASEGKMTRTQPQQAAHQSAVVAWGRLLTDAGVSTTSTRGAKKGAKVRDTDKSDKPTKVEGIVIAKHVDTLSDARMHLMAVGVNLLQFVKGSETVGNSAAYRELVMRFVEDVNKLPTE